MKKRDLLDALGGSIVKGNPLYLTTVLIIR